MKKVPYGIIDFRTLIEEGYEYVDKTMYLLELEKVGKTLIYLRPGRFGKSLFTSMMFYYYDLNSEPLFESLFKDTYVYTSPTKNKNNYYVLNFDFSALTTEEKDNIDLEVEFKGKLKGGIEQFFKNYGYRTEIDYDNLTPNRILLEFFVFFDSLNLEHKLYILIDEYDNFTNAILSGDGKDFKSVVGNGGFVKSFYAQIKEYVKYGVVDRVFITGICPIILDSMTTGFNIATDISLDVRFDSMIGLTHDEVLKLMNDIEENKRKELFELMLKNYDGYLFSSESNSRVFNATLVMYFLDHYYSFNDIPKKLMDKNIVVNYGKIENLVKLQNNNFYKGLLNILLTTEEINGDLKTSFDLKIPFTEDDIISLLYYFGYLTINGENKYTGKTIFKVPNRIMSVIYNDFFIEILRGEEIIIDSNKIEESIKEITITGTINNITNYVSEILGYSDNRIFIKFDEKYIQLIFFTVLRQNPLINVYSEYPCKNGYVDLYLESKDELAIYNIMIEIKYIKKSEYSDTLLETKKNDAVSQLKQYELDERIDNLKKYVVIFVGCECKLIEEV